MSRNVSSELVTVAVFSMSADAELVRAQLRAAGIESQLTSGEGAAPAGQVHVQVAPGDFERAMRVLFPVPEPTRAADPPIASWTCPKCGQSVFEFSKVCWMCGTSREPATAASDAPGTLSTRPAIAAMPPSARTTSETPKPARLPRFAQLPPPPPPGMAPAGAPVPTQDAVLPSGAPAVPRFARLASASIAPIGPPPGQARPEVSRPLEPPLPAQAAAPVEPAAPLPERDAGAKASTVQSLGATPIVPVGPAPGVRARVDPKQKEIESMTRWAWWTSVVGLLVCPATVYSIWLLLTLTFAGARASRPGRLRCVGAWCVDLATIVGWYVFLQTRM